MFAAHSTRVNPPTPAIVSQQAVRRLPRLALLLFCAAYVLPGFIGRDPWKSADMMTLGYVWELAQGTTSWLQPTLLGMPPEFDALLPYWLGAWAVKLAPAWLHADFAARLPFVALLVLTLLGTWYGVYYLARSPGAQPVSFAFGGEARPADYARAMADGGLLALMACLGLAQLSHETTPAVAQLGFTALSFYGLAAMPYRGMLPAAMLLLGLAGLALSGAPTMALLFTLGGAAVSVMDHPRDAAGGGSRWRWAAVAVFGALVVIALSTSMNLWRWRLDDPMGAGYHDWRGSARLLLWFTWPAWPLAVWTLWRWRAQLTSRHVALPLWFVAVAIGTTLATPSSDRSLLLGLPAMATLAAFALPTFKRSVAALIDWFTLLFFSGCAIVIWVIWLSMQVGIPPKPAANIARLAPGFVPSFSLVAFLAALLGTLAWAWLVKWRAGRHRAAIWKSLVLPASGTALCWLLLMTLWLPVLDYARSYTPVVARIQQVMGSKPACVQVMGLNRGQLAALRFHGQLALEDASAQSRCPWLVATQQLSAVVATLDPQRPWILQATVRRPTDARDNLVVYSRPATR